MKLEYEPEDLKAIREFAEEIGRAFRIGSKKVDMSVLGISVRGKLEPFQNMSAIMCHHALPLVSVSKIKNNVVYFVQHCTDDLGRYIIDTINGYSATGIVSYSVIEIPEEEDF